MEPSHSSTELARLSSLVHNVLGWLLLALALLQLREALTPLGGRLARLLWPGAGALIGFGLAVWVFSHQILTHGVGPFDDPLQNQHQAIGGIVAFGATGEMLRREDRIGGWFAPIVWGTSLVLVGVVFLLHEQHAIEALLIHWALAATLILAGLCDVAAALTGGTTRAIRVLGILILGGAAVQLVVYQERPDAHGIGYHSPRHPEIAFPEVTANYAIQGREGGYQPKDIRILGPELENIR